MMLASSAFTLALILAIQGYRPSKSSALEVELPKETQQEQVERRFSEGDVVTWKSGLTTQFIDLSGKEHATCWLGRNFSVRYLRYVSAGTGNETDDRVLMRVEKHADTDRLSTCQPGEIIAMFPWILAEYDKESTEHIMRKAAQPYLRNTPD